MSCQVSQDPEAVSLRLQEFKKVSQPDLTVRIEICLSGQVVTEAIRSDLVEDQVIELGSGALLDRSLQLNLNRKIRIEAKLVGHLLKIVIRGLADLNLDLITDTELVLDMLGASHASEDATTNHDSKLSRQSFSLFHRVSRQNDCRLLISLTDFLNDLPHEPSSFWVHTCGRLVQQDYGRVSNQGHGD